MRCFCVIALPTTHLQFRRRHGSCAIAAQLGRTGFLTRLQWIEHQLAHEVKDPNGRAYNRTAFLAGRKKMMQAWADYLDGLRAQKMELTERVLVQQRNQVS
jgi:hypothetical protein